MHKCMNQTNYMEQSPSSEAKSHSYSPEILRLIWNQEVHYHVPERDEFGPKLTTYFPKIHFNIIFSLRLGALPFKHSNQNFVRISQLPHACYVPAHLILLDLITLIIFDEAQKLRSSSL